MPARTQRHSDMWDWPRIGTEAMVLQPERAQWGICPFCLRFLPLSTGLFANWSLKPQGRFLNPETPTDPNSVLLVWGFLALLLESQG
jgi:hypothetical protein